MQAGTRGLQGFKGDKGDPGTDYTPMIGNVETLNPGEPATASSSIDVEQDIVYFNFGIPQGYKGDKGDSGDMLFTTFDVVNGKLIAYYSQENRGYEFQLNGNKLEVVLDE